MASGELSDIIYTWDFDAKYDMWAKDELTWGLDDYIEKYPNLQNNITKQMWEVARAPSTDKIHAVPRRTADAMWGVVANLEWLDALGVEMPKTTDKLFEYGKLVATGDPDGNGKNDTFLMSPTGLWTDCWLVTAFLPFHETRLPDADETYMIREKMSGYLPYLTFMRDMYAEGIMDPEFFTNNYYDDRTKLHQNRVALLHAQHNTVVEFVNDVPNALEKFKFFPPVIGPEHTVAENQAQPSTWGGWQINAELDETRLRRILSFLDWANSKEGFVTFAAGVEGLHYESYDFDTRTLIKTPEQIDVANTHVSTYMTISLAYEGQTVSPSDTQEKNDYSNAEYEFFNENTTTIPVNTIMVPEYDTWKSDNPDIYSQKEELEISYIVGEITKEEFVSFLEDKYYPSILEAEEAYIAAAAALGL